MTIPRGFTRRGVLFGATALPLSLALRPARAQTTAAYAPTGGPAIPADFPQQERGRVAETVGVAHRDLAKVRALVEESPALANATWDWGFGDWETALGAASHTGQREIAEYLIAKGARPTLHSAAMLGQLEVVRAFVQSSPDSRHIPGPHGIPLIEHARAGGERARAVVEYLQSLPPTAAAPAPAPLDPQQRARFFGRYRFGQGENDVLEVLEQAEKLAIRRGDGSPRRLVPVGSEAFHPAGAPAVSITFQVDHGLVKSVTIQDGTLVVNGVRLGP